MVRDFWHVPKIKDRFSVLIRFSNEKLSHGGNFEKLFTSADNLFVPRPKNFSLEAEHFLLRRQTISCGNIVSTIWYYGIMMHSIQLFGHQTLLRSFVTVLLSRVQRSLPPLSAYTFGRSFVLTVEKRRAIFCEPKSVVLTRAFCGSTVYTWGKCVSMVLIATYGSRNARSSFWLCRAVAKHGHAINICGLI